MRRETQRGRARSRGLTYLELLVAVAVVAVLASVALPTMRWDQKRRDEVRLRETLRLLRDSIDQFKRYTDEGLIVQSDVDQMGYPRSLDDLVEGVEVGDPQNPESETIRFLPRIPVDPMTDSAEWGLRSYQDDWDSQSWGGQNVFDVYSLSDRKALDGTYYRDW